MGIHENDKNTTLPQVKRIKSNEVSLICLDLFWMQSMLVCKTWESFAVITFTFFQVQ